MRRPHLRLAAWTGTFLVAGAWAILDLRPRSVSGPEIALNKLIAHIQQIAAEPHSLGTAAHDRVKDYIAGTLRANGIETVVQQTTAPLDAGELFRVAEISNVLARIPGTHGGRAVLVVSHYDSAPASRGAADDGTAVASMLETAALLSRGPRLRNDVILLFTDGEEWGLLGARIPGTSLG